MRRIPKLLAVGTAAALVAAGAATVALGATGADDTDEPARTVRTSTASVERRTLVEREALDGTLGYGQARTAPAQRAGTVTAVAPPGSVVRRGERLFEIDGRPVVLLHGDRPAWRRMDATTDGPDVRQLEENLAAMGFVRSGELKVDERYTIDTARAVKRWEKALGLEQDGVVEPGDVVFLPDDLRVTKAEVGVGGAARPGEAVLSGTSTAKVVTVELDADRRTLVDAGDTVEVELPDGTVVPGRVDRVGTVAAAADDDQPGGGDEEATVEVVVVLDDPSAAGALDTAPVEVRVTSEQVDDVLTVPVNALLALAEGGYAVEVVHAGGTRLVRVEPGLFADGRVQVTGDLTEGAKVVVPA